MTDGHFLTVSALFRPCYTLIQLRRADQLASFGGNFTDSSVSNPRFVEHSRLGPTRRGTGHRLVRLLIHHHLGARRRTLCRHPGCVVGDAGHLLGRNGPGYGDSRWIIWPTGHPDQSLQDHRGTDRVVASHAAQALAQTRVVEKLVLVGTAATRFQVAPIAPVLHDQTLVLHGEMDETVPLADVMAWARPQSLPVTVIPGGEHFFHGQLPLLRNLVVRHLSAPFA